ncbi:DeoR/GlpR family DNA-binding transcription regulator [Telluribacter sp.]|jgi:DeoR/GlpR family transcriptional regulator of sugar metabolism|uniref:DeoR/GlpR family DNA-binding transcription regulator n=1 Tax=Telluribacter sp. TaxID=1978767 RepID=UPI002E140F6B|nr:DeoR/GlpR family DNA-binding transcription regulator [Telluribacter sp.]
MLKDERQHWILDKLNKHKKVSLVAISQELEVSYDSIRRDIIELEEQGLLKKVHGGAIANSYLPMRVRRAMGIPNAEITAIANKARCLFKNGQTVLMDGGTTNLYIAEQIPHQLEATIITNSLPLATSLANHPKVEVILLGGSFYKRYQITLGSETSAQLRHFRADLYFMGIVGIHPDEGLTIRHYEESQLKRQMMGIAGHTVVCATAEKINNVEAYQICQLKDIHTLITSPSDVLSSVREWPNPDVQIL